MILWAVSLRGQLMPKPPMLLPDGVRATDIFTVTGFANIFPVSAINAVLQRCERETIRVRTLPNEYVVFFVMMLALFRDSSHKEVYRCVAEAFQKLLGRFSPNKPIEIPSGSALSQARGRLGEEPFKILFNELAVVQGNHGQKGVFYRQWRKMAIDGSVMDTENTVENRALGSSKNQHETAASNPQIRFVTLMEIGTHLFVKAAMGGYKVGENALAAELFGFLDSKMILIADRNFYSFDNFKTVSKAGAALLFRIQRGMIFEPFEQLSDSSFLVRIHHHKDRLKANGLTARVIQYKVTGGKETIFLITNILSPTDAPAHELAQLYHERWEHENALDELKTHLNAKALTLRSKTPDLAKQELWGMLMTHYVIRSSMNEAAARSNLDSDQLSFTHSVHVVKRTLVKAASDFSP